MYEIKSQIRGTYSNFKAAHGSFNTEEAYETLYALDMQHYFDRNRPRFKDLNEMFEKLDAGGVSYVIERSFTERDFDDALGGGGDIDICTNDYYKFKRIVGGRNTSAHRKELDAGYGIQNNVKIGTKTVAIDIRSVGDNYYPNEWMDSILKTRIQHTNKYGTFYIPNKINQKWLLYYHIFVQHPERAAERKQKHIDTIKQLLKKDGIEMNLDELKTNFCKFLHNQKYSIETPEDIGVEINKKYCTIGENFKNIADEMVENTSALSLREGFPQGGSQHHLSQPTPSSVSKRFKNRDAYNIEKICYLRLKDEQHFPKIIKFDDDGLTLEITYVGKPITENDHIADFAKQISEIHDSLDKYKIRHGDIHIGNVLNKGGIIFLIDFGWAKDLSVPQEWTWGQGHPKFPNHAVHLVSPNQDFPPTENSDFATYIKKLRL